MDYFWIFILCYFSFCIGIIVGAFAMKEKKKQYEVRHVSVWDNTKSVEELAKEVEYALKKFNSEKNPKSEDNIRL